MKNYWLDKIKKKNGAAHDSDEKVPLLDEHKVRKIIYVDVKPSDADDYLKKLRKILKEKKSNAI